VTGQLNLPLSLSLSLSVSLRAHVHHEVGDELKAVRARLVFVHPSVRLCRWCRAIGVDEDSPDQVFVPTVPVATAEEIKNR